jgi:hypothetical protein
MAVILSLPAYERLQGQKQLADEERQLAANAFGMWADRSDIDDDWLVHGCKGRQRNFFLASFVAMAGQLYRY